MERFPEVVPASDHSLLVVFGRSIGFECHRRVLRFMTALEARRLPFVLNLHPAYSSVLVTFDPVVVSHAELEAVLEERLRDLDAVELPPPRTVAIPVCYDRDLGPDLEDVAALSHLTVDEVVRIHCGAEYRVYFLGFSPGFPYLGGMSPRIAAPRLATPRRHVPAGSVAIGGAQTGVYPLASPGGWRLVGRTPMRLFRPDESPPALLRMGDAVRFETISRAEFERLANAG